MKFILFFLLILYITPTFAQEAQKGIEVTMRVEARVFSSSGTPDQYYKCGASDLFLYPWQIEFNQQTYPLDSVWILQIQSGDTVEVFTRYQDEAFYSLDQTSQPFDIISGDPGIETIHYYSGTVEQLTTIRNFTDISKMRVGTGVFEKVDIEIVRYIPNDSTGNTQDLDATPYFLTVSPEEQKITLRTGTDTPATLSVYDETGQVIMETAIIASKELQMTNFETGVYYFVCSVDGRRLLGKYAIP